MNTAQSPYIPAKGRKPTLGDLPWLISFALRGFFELVRARVIFARLEARDIPVRNRQSIGRVEIGSGATAAELARITYILPRLSGRMPWRSDCLVQAVAGQNWLAALNTSSEIRIGVENPKDGDFGAHAWLVHGETVITGGDISRYSLLLAADTETEA